MATKLHQILALLKTVNSTTEGQVTKAFQDAKRTPSFNGFTRTYTSLDADDPDQLPAERKMVQLTVDDVLYRARHAWTRQADVVVTKDATNQKAQADVVVDGIPVLHAVPVTTLLYLEKMMLNVRTMLAALPVLDPEVDWGSEPDSASGQWRSRTPEKSLKMKKVPKSYIKVPATDKFPAQVGDYSEDITVGTWERMVFSGAIPAPRKRELLMRAEALQEAIKMAREEANKTDVDQRHIGAALFAHLLD